MLNASSGKCLISPVSRLREAREVLDLPRLAAARGGLGRVAGAGAVDQDAFLPVRRACRYEARVDRFVAGDVDGAEHPADVGGDGFALGRVHVEDRDLDPGRC